MRVLFYNWVDYRDPQGRGGGVAVYQRNLIAALSQRNDVETGFFCAGLAHDLAPRAPRWAAMGADRPRHWEIVNSAALAPAQHGFGQAAQVSDPETEAAVCDLVAATGPWDVLHLDNLEGLPAGVLAALKARFPSLRIVYVMHNYYPICPQVNLWHREARTCPGFDAGRACATCLPVRPETRLLRLSHALSWRLARAGLRPGGRAWKAGFGTLRLGARRLRALRARRAPAQAIPAPVDGAPFAARRAAMLEAVNTQCDAVLCVSDAVRRLAVDYGVDPARTHVARIGTAEAAAFARTAPRPVPRSPDAPLVLGYLGYMRRDKGFYFLLDALEALPDAQAARIGLMVAAKGIDAATAARLDRLKARLAGLTLHDGYRHADLDRLLADVDVGVVPVLWHDNLPQVAIEMHARHVPLLCSDRGGAQELGNAPTMVFPAGDAGAFHDRLRAILEGRVDFARYWQGARPPMDMARHVETLLGHYRPG
ncbi:glycosyltransferase [Citreimonas salinaria]|uniref:Glycosyltransferase involved in cell wall bisynthesis n=1 Tax=Citreimonas salinaria TaxID=321339 RepID=A0A1H3N4B2_9RHOB|nr:glycosyltransferase [Citreimonas salinaria]SDY83604.1 Glycosyltransferase involved in cell wall bisynthesis [Citreimonas salinaria]